MTYNVEVKHSASNGGWESRNPTTAIQTVINANPDIVGFQEDGDDWDSYLAELKNNGYANISSKYNGGWLNSWGNGWENVDIYYKEAKFEYITSGFEFYKEIAEEYPNVDDGGANMDIDKNGDDQFWWSDDAKGRMFSYVVLKDNDSGAIILVVNTHLHYGDGTGSEEKHQDDHILREYQARLMCAWLEDMKAEYPNQIVIGDMNAAPTSNNGKRVINEFTNSGLIFARDEAFLKGDVGGTLASTSTYKSRDQYVFDHILYRNMTAVEYSVINNMVDEVDGEMRYPSDHLPVIAKFICYAE